MMWNVWPQRWQAALAACARLGGDVHPLTMQLPALLPVIEAVEHELGVRIPTSFRHVLLQFAGGVDLAWFLPDAFVLPAPLDDIFAGTCSWDVARLVELDATRKGWMSAVFPDPHDAYDRVWHNTLAFAEVGNGDMLAIDLTAGDDGPVVYLSHDDGEGHGYRLGANFVDFMNRWSQLGCPGAEDWQLLLFIAGPESYIDPDSPQSVQWKQLFGLQE